MTSLYRGYFLFLFILLFRAALKAYGNSRAGVKSELQPLAYTTAQQCRIWAVSETYTTAHGNGRSLTHWARPGIELQSSWILVGFVTTEPQQELPTGVILILIPQKAESGTKIVWNVIPENTVRERGSERRKANKGCISEGVSTEQLGSILLKPFCKSGQNSAENSPSEGKEAGVFILQRLAPIGCAVLLC